MCISTEWCYVMKSYFPLLRQVISQRRVVDVHKNTANEQNRVAVHTLQYSKVLKLYFDCSPNIAFPEDSFSMRYLCLRLPRLLEGPLSLSCCEDIQYNSISLLFGIAHCGDLKNISVFLVVIIWHLNAIKTFSLQFCNICLFFKSPEIPAQVSEWPWLKVALEKEFYSILDTFIIALMLNKHLNLY